MSKASESGFVAEFLPASDPAGRPVIAFIVKRSYAIEAFEGRLSPLDEQPPIRRMDEPFEDEAELASPSVRAEAELFAEKPGADVVFNGVAHAPGGQAAASFDCALRVGEHTARLRLFGPRRCQYQAPRKAPRPDKETGRIDESELPPPRFTEPTPIARVALRMANAYGGESPLVVDEGAGEGLDEGAAPRIPCPVNPLGKGFALGNRAETIEALELPLIEDPERLLRAEDIPRRLEDLLAEEGPRPAGFGWRPRHWWPRAALSGLPPAECEAAQWALDRRILALDPEDPEQRAQARGLIDFQIPALQPDYFRGAAPALRFESLEGDEEVELTNLSERGSLFFRLPGERPHLTLDRGRGAESVALRLDTVIIDGEREELALLWRGRLAYEGPEAFAAYPRFDMELRVVSLEEARAEIWERARRQASADGRLDEGQSDSAPAPAAAPDDAEELREAKEALRQRLAREEDQSCHR